MEGGGEGIGEEVEVDGQEEFHEGDDNEHGERHYPEQVSDSPPKQLELSAGEVIPLNRLPEQTKRHTRVEGQQPEAVVVLQDNLLHPHSQRGLLLLQRGLEGRGGREGRERGEREREKSG